MDRANIIAIDVSGIDSHASSLIVAHLYVAQINHDVTPDSELLLHAAREVVEEEGFDQQLDDVRDRVDEIESLHRTRELTVGSTSFLRIPRQLSRPWSIELIIFVSTSSKM